MGPAPDADAIEAAARAAIERLPAAARLRLGPVAVSVAEEPDEDTLAAAGLDHPLGLTGVYAAVPGGGAGRAGQLRLFRQAILAEWCHTGVRLDDLVSVIVTDELGAASASEAE